MRSKGIDGVIRFRRALKKLITWRGVFDHFILACILTNCLFLALSDPSASPLYAHDEIWNAVLFVGDLAFTAIFCVEMLLKLLVYGVAFHPKAYLRSVWNWLDMLVVVFSVLGLLQAVLAMRAGDDGSSVPGIDELAGFAALRAVRLALWPACNAAEGEPPEASRDRCAYCGRCAPRRRRAVCATRSKRS